VHAQSVCWFYTKKIQNSGFLNQKNKIKSLCYLKLTDIEWQLGSTIVGDYIHGELQ
jgi:hypothetical protein